MRGGVRAGDSAIYLLRYYAINRREKQGRSLAEKTSLLGSCVLFTSLPYRLSSSHFSCTGRAVACIHPLTFHANLCLSVLVCVYDGEHKHVYTHTHARGCGVGCGGCGGRPRRGREVVVGGGGLVLAVVVQGGDRN